MCSTTSTPTAHLVLPPTTAWTRLIPSCAREFPHHACSRGGRRIRVSWSTRWRDQPGRVVQSRKHLLMTLDHRQDDAVLKILEFFIIHAERLLHLAQKPLSAFLRQNREVPAKLAQRQRPLQVFLRTVGCVDQRPRETRHGACKATHGKVSPEICEGRGRVAEYLRSGSERMGFGLERPRVQSRRPSAAVLTSPPASLADPRTVTNQDQRWIMHPEMWSKRPTCHPNVPGKRDLAGSAWAGWPSR